MLLPLMGVSQVWEDFSSGNMASWSGDTVEFKITGSSAIPPEMKPALQLNGPGSDTSAMVAPNAAMDQTEWNFWVKLSFNTSANNFARVYLASDNINLKGPVNGYFIGIGGATDSIMLARQSGTEVFPLIKGIHAYTGNSTNVFRIRTTRDGQGNWSLFSDNTGGYDYIAEGTAQDNTWQTSQYFGIYCKYTSSNAQKFYFDDLYAGGMIVDTLPPSLIKLTVLTDTTLQLTFSEEVTAGSASDTANFFVDGGMGHPHLAVRDPENYSSVLLTFPGAFNANAAYDLSICCVSDKYGNAMPGEHHSFTYEPPSPASPCDIVINEIMTDINPPPEGLPEAEYLELYNRTADTLNLFEWKLRPGLSSSLIPLPGVIILPDSFLLIVHEQNIDDFSGCGPVCGLPGFSMNNEGSVFLYDPSGNTVSTLSYTSESYHDPDKAGGGWSLEQIDPFNPCLGDPNWKASISDEGGTPGKRNSVLSQLPAWPEIESIEVLDEYSINIRFTHKMDPSSLANINAYFLSDGAGHPSEALPDTLTCQTVKLIFDSLQTDHVYHLTLNGTFFDCAGTAALLEDEYEVIVPRQCHPFEVVITEIMADPSPPRGLPVYEYLEVYNRSSSFFSSGGWKLNIGNTSKSLPSLILGPHEFVIITENEAAGIFTLFGNTIGLSSLGLTNAGEDISLTGKEGDVLCSVSYSDSWYGDAIKKEGGWSLEMIDPGRPCLGAENWTASAAWEGGTPGAENSVKSTLDVSPSVKSIISILSNTIELTFSERMDTGRICVNHLYEVDRGIGNPIRVFPATGSAERILLEFEREMATKTLYTLKIQGNMINCTGEESVIQTPFVFGIAEVAEAGDIIINEVLFNPWPGGVDFIEIYNPSDKIIDLGELWVGSVDHGAYPQPDTEYVSLSAFRTSLLPGGYKALTVNPGQVTLYYRDPGPEAFLVIDKLPALDNDEGTIVLKQPGGHGIDRMHYTEAMHFPLLNNTEGISLERINPSGASDNEANWHSASESSGFATPGARNSQYGEWGALSDPVTLEPEIFSPDNDGYNDVLQIVYNIDQPGFAGSVLIFDASGRLVRNLVRNDLLGSEGSFAWDGIMEDRQPAPAGVYIIYFEIFNPEGKVKRYKKPSVLALRR